MPLSAPEERVCPTAGICSAQAHKEGEEETARTRFKNNIRSSGVSPVCSNCPTPEVSPFENHSSSLESLDNISLRHGTIIPNRIFVGGFDHKVSERDLCHIFSHFGTVMEVNIVQNRSRQTKGFGFVTFENSGDVRRLLCEANAIHFRDKRLSIRPAVCKQHNSGNSNGHMYSPEPLQQIPCGAMYLTTSSGFPYTFHNGVAYFHSPQVNPAPHLWTPPPPPVMVPPPCQPMYHQPAYHHHQQPRYFPNHCQWNNVEAPVGSGPVTYAQPEYMQPPLPHMDDNNAEFYDPVMYQSYSMYPHRERFPRFVPPHEYGKNHMYQSFQGPLAPVYNPNRDHPSAPEQPESEPQGPPSAQ